MKVTPRNGFLAFSRLKDTKSASCIIFNEVGFKFSKLIFYVIALIIARIMLGLVLFSLGKYIDWYQFREDSMRNAEREIFPLMVSAL